MSKPNRFFGLHAHSGRSVFDGLGPTYKHFDFVLSNGGEGMAITEHGHLNSFAESWKYYKEKKNTGEKFKYIPGIESYIIPSLSDWKKMKEDAENSDEDEEVTATIEDENESKKVFKPLNRRHHLVILPKNSQGLKDLFRLTSFGYLEGFYRFPRIDHKAIQEINKNKNLCALSACLAGQPAWEMFQECLDIEWDNVTVDIVKEREHVIMPRLRDMINQYIDSFGIENYFLELQFNKLNPQHAINYLLIKLAKETGIQLVSTCDSHYYSRDKWQAREMYKRLRPGNWKYGDGLPQSIEDLKCELFPKNETDMWEEYLLHRDKYDFYDDEIVSNSIEKSYDIAFDLIGDLEVETKIQMPSFLLKEGEDVDEKLRTLAYEGLKNKNRHEDKEYIDRIEEELRVIKSKGFSLYFITMKDILSVLSKHTLIGAGRGSAAGSLLCYCLDITKIDPIKYGLIFSRFLSEKRSDYPDIDCDIADKDLAFKILQEHYGQDNAIAISNVNTFGFKGLVKSLSKFLGIEYAEVNNVVKSIDFEIKEGMRSEGLEFSAKLVNLENAKKYSIKFADFVEKHPELENFIGDIYGEQMSIGRHAGGILIADNIPEKMPVIVSKKMRQTPWNKNLLEDYGWIKFDLLGLETLKIVENCISLILKNKFGLKNPEFADIKKFYDENLHPDKLDLDDKKVFNHVYENGNLAGIFQVTEKKTQEFFRNAQPNSILEISDLTALYRPGPMEMNAHHSYVKRKHGEEKISYNHAIEKEFLAPSKGLLCYQEQMMFMVNKIGGLSLAETDIFRKVVSKKPEPGTPLYDTMLSYKEIFLNGAISKGIETELAHKMWDSIEAFAGYAFNKSHSVSYSVLSYVTAYLLTYYEAEWLCAYVETQLNKPDDKAKAIYEVKSFGYDFVKIDINEATHSWTSIQETKKLMPSFLSCKGVGKAAVDEILDRRPYRSIYELLWKEDGKWRHTKFNKTVFSVLVKIEAFDSLDCVGEGKLFKNYAHMHRVIIENWNFLKKKLKKDTFDTQCQKLEDLIISTDDKDWTPLEKIEVKKELLGQIDIDLIIPKKKQDKLYKHGYYSIDAFPDGEKNVLSWFIIDNKTIKTTRGGSKYLVLNVVGISGKTEIIKVWNWDEKVEIRKYSAYRAWVKKDAYGFSTKIENMAKM